MRLVTLRSMEPADAGAVAAIEAAVFEAPWSAGILRDELGADRRTYLVAEDDLGGIVGYAGLMIVEDDAHITTIAVVPTMRGRGVAKRLMVALYDAAVAGGARHMTLEVRESNAAAQGLYDRFGFSTVGRRKGYYRTEDAVVMWATNIDSDAYRSLIDSIRTTTEAAA